MPPPPGATAMIKDVKFQKVYITTIYIGVTWFIPFMFRYIYIYKVFGKAGVDGLGHGKSRRKGSLERRRLEYSRRQEMDNFWKIISICRTSEEYKYVMIITQLLFPFKINKLCHYINRRYVQHSIFLTLFYSL